MDPSCFQSCLCVCATLAHTHTNTHSRQRSFPGGWITTRVCRGRLYKQVIHKQNLEPADTLTVFCLIGTLRDKGGLMTAACRYVAHYCCMPNLLNPISVMFHAVEKWQPPAPLRVWTMKTEYDIQCKSFKSIDNSNGFQVGNELLLKQMVGPSVRVCLPCFWGVSHTISAIWTQVYIFSADSAQQVTSPRWETGSCTICIF